MGKNLDPNIKPEKQHANPIKDSVVKPHIGQGKAGLKRKRPDPINQTINPPSEMSQKTSGETKIGTGKTIQIHSKDPMYSANNVDEGMTHTRPLIPDVPFHPGPTYRPPPKPIRSNMPKVSKGHKVHLVQRISIQILIQLSILKTFIYIWHKINYPPPICSN